MTLTNREHQVLELIRQDPLITQLALARRLGISRSAAAGHVMRLTDKGAIRGRGYLLNEEPYVCVLGGANVDIEGRSTAPLRERDSNSGSVHFSPGGVGRNIAENLARLGTPTRLITALGTDSNGRWLHEQAVATGVDMAEALWCDGHRTATYLSTLDQDGEMTVAINDMGVLAQLSPRILADRHDTTANASAIALDANLPAETLDYLFASHSDAIFFVDTVSATKATRLVPHLAAVHTLKPNRTEAGLLSGIDINSRNSLKRAAAALLDLGVKRVVISLGAEGLFYADSDSSAVVAPPPVTVASVTGAGDALLAALVHAHMADWPAEAAAQFAVTAAALATRSERTVSPDMSVDAVNQLMPERQAS